MFSDSCPGRCSFENFAKSQAKRKVGDSLVEEGGEREERRSCLPRVCVHEACPLARGRGVQGVRTNPVNELTSVT